MIYDISGKIKEEIKGELEQYIDKHHPDRDLIRFSRVLGPIGETALNVKKSFSTCLIEEIDARGYLDPDVYGRAKISRQLFNKIKNDVLYHPTKNTAICLILALHLTVPEAQQLLETAGYTLSNSIRADLIVKYCLEHGIYAIKDVDELLKAFGEKPLNSDNRE